MVGLVGLGITNSQELYVHETQGKDNKMPEKEAKNTVFQAKN